MTHLPQMRNQQKKAKTFVALVCILATTGFAEEPQERHREETLNDGTKIVQITKMFALASETYVYAPDGTFRSHVAKESHPNGRLVCRRSYDAHEVLLAFQTFTYDREWKPRAVRTFNARGKLVLYATTEPNTEPGAEPLTTFYTSDAPDRKVVQLGSEDYIKIVLEHHLEAFQ